MNIDFNKKIEKKLKKDIEIPKVVLDKANIAFEEIRSSKEEKSNKSKSFKKPLIAAMSGICIFSLIAFSSPVMAAINSFFSDIGIKKATNNGYVQTLPESAVKDNGVAINVDDIVADKTKIAISFTLNFEDASKLKKINDIGLGLNIKDDKGRYLIEDLEEGPYTLLLSGTNWNTDTSNKDKGEIKYYFLMNSTEGNLGDINELAINIDSINLYEEEKGKSEEEISGNWDFSVALDDKFTNKEEIKFKAENESDILEIVSAEMLPTGMLVEFIVNAQVDENIVGKVSMIDENKNEFDNFSVANMEDMPNGGAKISMIFDVTTFDNVDKLKMIVKDINGKDITLDLVKDVE